jgi:serine/threonine-protein kinase
LVLLFAELSPNESTEQQPRRARPGANPLMALIVGEQFAGYEVLSELGQGGMGAVYQARQIALQRIVALKILPPVFAADKNFLSRFQSEAVTAASLNHPNIVHVYAAGEFSGIQYIAMEFVEGETIQHRVRRCGRLPLTEALDVAYHVATALDHAWQTARLIHRDVKPDNIFLAQNGTLKLGDFGLAKVLREGAASQTVTGHIMGSPHFISPEQARGQREIDARADIYSLGCTLHYMMTGRTVFEAPDFMSILYKHVNEEPEPIQTLLPNCPAAVSRLLTKMIRKDPAERFQNYAELLEQILAARADAVVWEAGDERQRRRMAADSPRTASRRAYVAAALMALIVAAGIGYAKRTDRARAVSNGVTLADPSDRRDFIQSVEDLTPPERVQRVFAKMRELNPEYAGQEKYTVEAEAITELTFSSVGVRNLWPLCALKHLRVLKCAGDATNKRRGDLADLSALSELTELEELDCSWTDVEDLQPLSRHTLMVLKCANTRVRDLSPLKDLAVLELDISGTAIGDLTPLHGKPIESLRMNDTRVRDLTPLRDAPLQEVWCEPSLLRSQANIVKSWKKLQRLNNRTPR